MVQLHVSGIWSLFVVSNITEDWLTASASLIWWCNTPLTAFSDSNLSLNISRCQTDPARTGLPSWNLYSSVWARLCWGNKQPLQLSDLQKQRFLSQSNHICCRQLWLCSATVLASRLQVERLAFEGPYWSPAGNNLEGGGVLICSVC